MGNSIPVTVFIKHGSGSTQLICWGKGNGLLAFMINTMTCGVPQSWILGPLKYNSDCFCFPCTIVTKDIQIIAECRTKVMHVQFFIVFPQTPGFSWGYFHLQAEFSKLSNSFNAIAAVYTSLQKMKAALVITLKDVLGASSVVAKAHMFSLQSSPFITRVLSYNMYNGPYRFSWMGGSGLFMISDYVTFMSWAGMWSPAALAADQLLEVTARRNDVILPAAELLLSVYKCICVQSRLYGATSGLTGFQPHNSVCLCVCVFLVFVASQGLLLV